MTTTVRVVLVELAEFLQSSVKLCVPGVVIFTKREPPIPKEPDHAPLPEQLLACLVDQVSSVVCPTFMVASDAFSTNSTFSFCTFICLALIILMRNLQLKVGATTQTRQPAKL